jgi:FlaG/FlaF family flagellin (archaellin)
MTHEHRETVVVEDDRGGSGLGAILGIIAIVVLLAAVWYFALGPGAASTAPSGGSGTNAPAATQQAPTDAPAASAAPAAS